MDRKELREEMGTRTLRIWHGIHTRNGVNVSTHPQAEYKGTYISQYETPNPARKMRRIGLIMDMVKGRAAVFSQLVASPDDLPPTDIVIGMSGEKDKAVLEAWSSDPQLAEPWGPDVPCAVLDFCEREPTAEEQSRLELLRT